MVAKRLRLILHRFDGRRPVSARVRPIAEIDVITRTFAALEISGPDPVPHEAKLRLELRGPFPVDDVAVTSGSGRFNFSIPLSLLTRKLGEHQWTMHLVGTDSEWILGRMPSGPRGKITVPVSVFGLSGGTMLHARVTSRRNGTVRLHTRKLEGAS